MAASDLATTCSSWGRPAESAASRSRSRRDGRRGDRGGQCRQAGFRPLPRRLARVASGLRIAYAVGFAVAIGQLLPVTRCLGGELSSGTTAARQVGVEAGIDHFNDVWHVALTLFGLHLAALAVLARKAVYRRS